MRVITTYPKEASKLYHRKPGQVIQVCRNDGAVDSNFYLVTNSMHRGSSTHTEIVNISNGVSKSESVSVRTVLFEDAVLLPNGMEE